MVKDSEVDAEVDHTSAKQLGGTEKATRDWRPLLCFLERLDYKLGLVKVVGVRFFVKVFQFFEDVYDVLTIMAN